MNNKKLLLLLVFGMLMVFVSCQQHPKQETPLSSLPKLDSAKFDSIIDGKKVGLYHIKNSNGLEASFTNFGGRIISLLVPDKNGRPRDVVLGFNSLAQYVHSPAPYFGAIIGRYANRIEKGEFTIDGKKYQIPINSGLNASHGGSKGFQYVVWDTQKLNDSTLQFNYLSKDGEMGFPGNMQLVVQYQLTAKNALKISYEAISDKKTIVNLTNHAFFNLNGEGSGTILNHKLQIFANSYTPVDSNAIPTGELAKVNQTPFDFKEAHQIGERIDENNEQLKFGQGYDHNFVLSETGDQKHAAQVIADKSGIVMDIYTDQPGLQFYSGNFMKEKNTFKSGAKDVFRTAFCLETQHFPNSPNQANFPSTILNPGEKFTTVSYFQFSTNK